MIEVVWTARAKDCVMEMAASGHAGYAPAGQDIVCAAVSCLMETLAYSCGDRCDCIVDKQPDGGVEMRVTAEYEPYDGVESRFQFVADGLDLLQQAYPDNVRFIDRTSGLSGDIELQRFAEGGGDGGAAGGESAPAGIAEPALTPAQERLARRSGALKKGSSENGMPSQQRDQPAAEPLAAPPVGEPGVEEKADAEKDGGEQNGKEEKKAPSREERRKAFGQLMQGEYAEEFGEVMQRAIDEATKQIRENPKIAALQQALAEAYGMDADDLDALTEAVKNGRVKNEEYYEQLAAERGVSVKTARELDKMESDLRRANSQQQKMQQMQQEMQRAQRAAAYRAQWDAEAAALAKQYPGFDLQQVLGNEQIGDLMRRGVKLADAYRAVYFDQIMQQATAATAQQVEKGVTDRIQQRAKRPAENGTNPGGAAVTKLDVANMTRRQREELERRARRGEIITL